MEHLNSLCSQCGFPKSMTTDERHEHDFEALGMTCFACRERDAEIRRIQDDAAERGEIAKADLDGLMVAVIERSKSRLLDF